MAMVVVPTVVHVVPFADSRPVTVVPLRTRRTHRGGAPVDPPVLTAPPFLVGRHCIAAPLAADTSIKACADPGSSVSRIMTPAFDQLSACWTLTTRAWIEPSPVSG